jgi:hypothetical protein
MMKKCNFFLIVTTLLLCSCESTEPVVAKESAVELLKDVEDEAVLDSNVPVLITEFKGGAYPEFFEAAFVAGTQVEQGERNFVFEKHELGEIACESGKIIACDPIAMQKAPAFTAIFPKGVFPVHLAIAKTGEGERVALARILFSEQAVVKWKYALRPGQKEVGFKDTTFYCYSVDAGTAIFIDEKSNKIFDFFKENAWDSVFVDKMERYHYKGFIHKFEKHTLAAFSTGLGDGCYAAYIGYDAQGKVCQLLTDFTLVAWWKVPEGI